MKIDTSNLDLDELDLKLIGELEIDARQSTRELGKKLGVSASTISLRMRKMIDKGWIAFASLTDPHVIGMQVEALWGLKLAPGKAANVLKYFKGLRNVQNLGSYTGRYDLMVYTIFRDNEELLHWVINVLGQISDILAIEQMNMTKVIKNSFTYLSDNNVVQQPSAYQPLDDLDCKLIKELELEPRESAEVIGKKAGLSRKPAARRMKRLLDESVVRVICMVDPMVLGLSVRIALFVKVQPYRIVTVSNILAADSRIKHLGIISGSSNLMIFVALHSLEEASHFMMNDLGNIPGVLDHEAMIQVGKPYSYFHLMNWALQ